MALRKTIVLLTVATTFQVVALLGMFALAAKPLWTGEQIRVRVQPVDPRSLFRGNYARLAYEFSSFPAAELVTDEAEKRWRKDEIVYVKLQPVAGGLYAAEGVYKQHPGGVVLRGRARKRTDRLRVKFGIEAFFAPKQEALALEKNLREGGVAVLMVDASGKAALKDIVPAMVRLD